MINFFIHNKHREKQEKNKINTTHTAKKIPCLCLSTPGGEGAETRTEIKTQAKTTAAHVRHIIMSAFISLLMTATCMVLSTTTTTATSGHHSGAIVVVDNTIMAAEAAIEAIVSISCHEMTAALLFFEFGGCLYIEPTIEISDLSSFGDEDDGRTPDSR